MYAVSSHEALMVQNHQDQDEEVGFIIEELGDNDIYRVFQILYFCFPKLLAAIGRQKMAVGCTSERRF